jgi:glyoxylase-like metal-dependent hydrolase (beta-lactamase superfamily II)
MRNVPSFLRWTVGDVVITRVVEQEAVILLETLIPSATAVALARHRDWLQPAFLHADGCSATLSIHAFVIESQGRRIIVDTCVGEHASAAMGPPKSPNPFLDDLAAAGLPRESIDVVLCTHLHFDHVGWNTMRVQDRWVPTFPQARYLFARREWEHWSATADREVWANYTETIAPVLDAGLHDLVTLDHRLTDEVSLEPTTGHTPGHVSVKIESRGQRALITGDMSHHPVQWAETEWSTVADADGAAAAVTRRQVLASHRDDPRCLILGTHYATPTGGHLVTAGDAAIFRAAPTPKE